jgi:hypothetical protein
MGSCGSESTGNISGDWGGLEVDSIAGWLSGVKGEGGEKQLSSCGIYLFLLRQKHDYCRELPHCRFFPVS